MTTTLILLRHGQSDGNKDRIFAGQMDLPLTELGLQQAECAADYLKQFPIDCIYASDLSRAYNTGLAVAKRQNLPIHTDTDLREIYAGDWEGLKYDEIIAKYPHNYRVWLDDMGNAQTNGGESVQALYSRVTDKICSIVRQNTGKTILIATHAAPIRMMECFAIGEPAAYASHFNWVPNASATIFSIDSDFSFRLLVRGENSYLGDLSTSFSKNI